MGSGFERPRVLGVAARNAFSQDGDRGDFERLEEILSERIRAAEIRMIKQAGLCGRLRSLLRAIRLALAPEDDGQLDDLLAALGHAATAVTDTTARMVTALEAELGAVLERKRSRFEKTYHALRDQDVGGPYGLFLRLQSYLAGRVNTSASPGGRRASWQPSRLRLQSIVAETLSRTHATLRPLGLSVDELAADRPELVAERLMAEVRRVSDETYLETMPPPRHKVIVNLVPTGVIASLVVGFLYLAIAGREPGLAFLVAGLILVVIVSYAQFLVLRTIDRRGFLERVHAQQGAVDLRALITGDPLHHELVEAGRHVGLAHDQVERLHALDRRVGALRADVQALPDELAL
jgi:hypothetical protein